MQLYICLSFNELMPHDVWGQTPGGPKLKHTMNENTIDHLHNSNRILKLYFLYIFIRVQNSLNIFFFINFYVTTCELTFSINLFWFFTRFKYMYIPVSTICLKIILKFFLLSVALACNWCHLACNKGDNSNNINFLSPRQRSCKGI